MTHTHTQTRLTALFPGLPGWAGTRKVKPIWTLLKQETVSGSGIRWAECKSAPRSRQITTPAPQHSVFLQAGCPSCHPTNSIRALKALPSDTAISKQLNSTVTDIEPSIFTTAHGCSTQCANNSACWWRAATTDLRTILKHILRQNIIVQPD